MGVFRHAAPPIHALDEALLGHHSTMLGSEILDTAVAVKDRLRRRMPGSDGVATRASREVRGLLLTQRPANDASRVAIHNGGQIAPLAAGFEIGDVTYLDLVGPGHLKTVSESFRYRARALRFQPPIPLDTSCESYQCNCDRKDHAVSVVGASSHFSAPIRVHEPLPVPLGDNFNGTVDHFDGSLIVNRATRHRHAGSPSFCVGHGIFR